MVKHNYPKNRITTDSNNLNVHCDSNNQNSIPSRTVVALTVAIFACCSAFSAAPIKYLDWDANNKMMVEKTCSSYTIVTANTASFANGGWYVVQGEISRERITVNGSAHLIICDGASLSLDCTSSNPAISVTTGKSITIYGQTESSGKLYAHGGDYSAGIGGRDHEACGSVTINGGVITAIGASGIGGGNMAAGGIVTINGGTISCSGNYGAGIGGGYSGAGGTVTINGGAVTASGSSWSACIGSGGCESTNYPTKNSGGDVTINNGLVTLSEQSPATAGLGCGLTDIGGTLTINGGTVIASVRKAPIAYNEDGIVTINGGEVKAICNSKYLNGKAGIVCVDGSTVTINGGTIIAEGGSGSAGIGGNNLSSVGTITINGGNVTSSGGPQAAGIGGGHQSNGGIVTINGGQVSAKGGSLTTSGNDIGAGIGSGYFGSGGTVTITGGKIIANSNEYGDDIGCGCKASGTIVAISGGIFGIDVDESWLVDGYEVIDNTDPSTCEKYPNAVVLNSSKEVIVPESWLEELEENHGTPDGAKSYQVAFEAKYGSNFTEALKKQTGKRDAAGNQLQVWHDFVAGTDPLNEKDVFTATVSFENEIPIIKWTPMLPPASSALRKYTTYGATRIDGAWIDISSLSDVERRAAGYKFFKVTVEMK